MTTTKKASARYLDQSLVVRCMAMLSYLYSNSKVCFCPCIFLVFFTNLAAPQSSVEASVVPQQTGSRWSATPPSFPYRPSCVLSISASPRVCSMGYRVVTAFRPLIAKLRALACLFREDQRCSCHCSGLAAAGLADDFKKALTPTIESRLPQ